MLQMKPANVPAGRETDSARALDLAMWAIPNSASSSLSRASRSAFLGTWPSSTARMLPSTLRPRKIELSCGR